MAGWLDWRPNARHTKVLVFASLSRSPDTLLAPGVSAEAVMGAILHLTRLSLACICRAGSERLWTIDFADLPDGSWARIRSDYPAGLHLSIGTGPGLAFWSLFSSTLLSFSFLQLRPDLRQITSPQSCSPPLARLPAANPPDVVPVGRPLVAAVAWHGLVVGIRDCLGLKKSARCLLSSDDPAEMEAASLIKSSLRHCHLRCI